MARATVIFDLESTPCPALGVYTDRSGQPALDKDGAPAFAPPPFHRVEMIGALVLVDDKVAALDVIDLERDGVPDEAATIANFVERVERRSPRLVGFNSRGFDLPVLQARAMRHGIAFPASFNLGTRYQLGAHVDLKDYLTNFGAAASSRLDHWSRLIGWPGKLDDSGAMVSEVLARPDGRDHLRHYCAADTVLTAAVFMRTMLLVGEWQPARYVAAAHALVDGSRRLMPGLAPWLDGIDEVAWTPPSLTVAPEVAA